MTDEISNPVVVTGQQRPHPAVQLLARACIALARLREDAAQAMPNGMPNPPDDDAEPTAEDARADRGRAHD